MEAVTYEFLRKIQREEQESSKLSKLPENFYEKVKSYLNQKRDVAKKELKVGRELKSAEKLIEDIFGRRERKIVNFAINMVRAGVFPENLTQEEKVFFENLVSLLKKRREEILENILKGELKESVKMVVFLKDVPQFVGIDENVYGPFKKGDIAKLPEENIKVLVEKGLAEEFKIEI